MFKITNKVRNEINKARKGEAIYFDTIGHIVQNIEKYLEVVGITLESGVMSLSTGNSRLLMIDPEGHEIQTSIVDCSIYRMPSGRYELNWYVS